MEENVKWVYELARKDPVFKKMERSCSDLEKLFEKTVYSLPSRQQDILWGFVLKSEEVNRYLLELAVHTPYRIDHIE